jgi:hypothetical protein
MSLAAAPPSPQEIHRKLSVHSAAQSARPSNVTVAPVSGTESDSDSIVSPDFVNTSAATGHSGLYPGPLTSIAERRVGSGGEDSEDEDEEVGGWKTADAGVMAHNSVDEGVIKAGYLWKKGERRKTWKKRWFVLRPAHLAYYKTSAEYQLLRLLELADVHSCTKVNLKKHDNTFGLVSPVRTFYLQAKTQAEVQEWVNAIDEARETLMATSTQNSMTNPIPIPTSKHRATSHPHPPVTPSPPRTYGFHSQNITSSDSDDASPVAQRTYSSSSQTRPPIPSSPTKPHLSTANAKTIVAGYLMKCGSKRHNWRKRYFMLTCEKLVYSGSHMDTKPHRQFPFSEILDALEYDLPANRQNPALISPLAASSPPISATVPDEGDDTHAAHTFKIITTKRTLLLCSASEEEEIKWLGAVRALIARRSGAGVVPGEKAWKTTGSNTSAEVAPSSLAAGSGGNSGGHRGKTRRLSASGPALAGSVEEGRLEKQVL